MATKNGRTAANGKAQPKVEETRRGAAGKTWTYGGEQVTVNPSICELVNSVRLGGMKALNAFGGSRNAEPRRRNYALLTGKPAPKAVTLAALVEAFKAWKKANPKAHVPKRVTVDDPDYEAKVKAQAKSNGNGKSAKVEQAEAKEAEQAKSEPQLFKLDGSKEMKECEYVEAKKLLTVRFRDGKVVKHAPVKSITFTYMKQAKNYDAFYANNLRRLAA